METKKKIAPWNLSRVLTNVNSRYGAPMGRWNVGYEPYCITRGNNGRICKVDQVKVYDKRISLINGYDRGGAYWGISENGEELRVRFTTDLSYVEFYWL